MPLIVICCAKKEVVDMFVDMLQVAGSHGFECFGWDSGEASCFSILQFLNSFAKFFPTDWIVEFP
jgi:hypothetical protein